MEEAKSYPSSQELFDRIYFGAKEENLPKILSALEYTTITIQVGIYNPVSKLLSEETVEAKKAIEFLFKNFPNERMILFDESIIVFAIRGDQDKVNAILAQAFDPVEKLELIDSAAYGYLRSGHTEEYKALGYELDITSRFKAYALQGKKVSDLTFPTDPKEKFEALSGLLNGYADNGHVNLVNDFIDKMELGILEKSYIYRIIAYRYIVNGYPKEAENLVQTNPFEEQFELLLSCMLACAFINDSMSIQNILRHALSDEDRIRLKKIKISGYALGGHLLQVNHSLEEKEPLVSLNPYYILKFAEAQNENEVKKRLLQIQDNLSYDTYIDIYSKIISYYIDGGCLIPAVKLLELINHPRLKPLFINVIVKKLNEKGLFLENHSALFIMALFDLNYQRQIADTIGKPFLISRAAALHPLLITKSHLTHPINYRYRIGKDWPQMLEFILMTGAYLTVKYGLPQDTLVRISSYLGAITTEEAFEFSNRLFTHFRPNLFYKNLAKKDLLLTTDLRVDEISTPKKMAKLK